jgi:hypothetical protein
MVGDFEDKKNKGIIPRSFEYIFDQVRNDKEYKYNIQLAFIQIYLENVILIKIDSRFTRT